VTKEGVKWQKFMGNQEVIFLYLITHELPPYTAHQVQVIPAGVADIQCIGMYI